MKEEVSVFTEIPKSKPISMTPEEKQKEYRCPKCGGHNIKQHRKPTGKMWCSDCNYCTAEKQLLSNPFMRLFSQEEEKAIKIMHQHDDGLLMAADRDWIYGLVAKEILNALPEESEYIENQEEVEQAMADYALRFPAVANQIAIRKIEEYKTSLVMYKKGTMAVLDRVIDWLSSKE